MSPDKPTRGSATEAGHPHEMYGARAGQRDTSGAASDEDREEKGTAAGSRRHPPHVSENSEDAEVQGEDSAPGEVPVLPANAHGTDKVSTEEHDQGIDDSSMYDRRRGEDKDRPPSAG